MSDYSPLVCSNVFKSPLLEVNIYHDNNPKMGVVMKIHRYDNTDIVFGMSKAELSDVVNRIIEILDDDIHAQIYYTVDCFSASNLGGPMGSEYIGKPKFTITFNELSQAMKFPYTYQDNIPGWSEWHLDHDGRRYTMDSCAYIWEITAWDVSTDPETQVVMENM